MAGRTVVNGYGKAHKRLRADLAQRMRKGEIFACWRCGRRINPAQPWDLGHDDRDRSIYRGPEHVSCNRATRNRRVHTPKLRRWVL
jgi:hypothetical protein